jgi:hypothetical protein
MIQRARHTGIETTGYLPGRFNRQLAQEAELSETEQTSDVEVSEVGLTQSTEKK